jgi:hypothetical protein
MKKFTKIIVIVFGFFVLFSLSYGLVKAEETDSSKLSVWGDYLSKLFTSDKSDTSQNDKVLIGTNGYITNSDIDMAKQFYITKDLEASAAETEAIKYVEEREALYQAAIKKGFTVTDEEITSYLDELKKTIEQADNKDDAYTIISKFDSEDAYWDFEYTVYQKNLPIQKYVASLEQEYYKENTTSSDTDWANYFEKLKAQLVADENFQYIK